MPDLLRFSKAPEGPASPLWDMARTPFALMQQCPVDDIAPMNRLIDIGGDGIITNYPDRLRDLIETRSYPLPRRFEMHR
jgi:hypothetical protein